MTQSPIKVRIDRTFEGVSERRLIETTLGKLIFNENIPQDLGFQPRNCMDDMFKLEIDKVVVKKDLGNIVERCFRVHGVNVCARVLDNIKAMGYKYSTRGAITVAVSDIIIPPEKADMLKAADDRVRDIEKKFRRGLMTDDQRYRNVINTWNDTTAALRGRVLKVLPQKNHDLGRLQL